MFERSRKGENALLIQPYSGLRIRPCSNEFKELARSAGANVVATVTAKIGRRNPAHYIGTGKLEEVKLLCESTGADLVCSTSCFRQCRNATSKRRSAVAWSIAQD